MNWCKVLNMWCDDVDEFYMELIGCDVYCDACFDCLDMGEV